VFDDSDPLRIASFLVFTESKPGTCVMRAVDKDWDSLGTHDDPIEVTVGSCSSPVSIC
jgi:hypothetical protein